MIVGLLVDEVESGPEWIRFEGEEGPLHVGIAGARDHLHRPQSVRICNHSPCHMEGKKVKE